MSGYPARPGNAVLRGDAAHTDIAPNCMRSNQSDAARHQNLASSPRRLADRTWASWNQHQRPAAHRSVCCRADSARRQTHVFLEEPAWPIWVTDKTWDLV